MIHAKKPGRRCVFLLLTLTVAVLAGEQRPVKDDVGFCWKADQISGLMKYLQQMETTPSRPLPPLVAGVSPHDDFLYAGNIYYPLMSRIQTNEVVIFGVTHGTVRRAIGDPQEKIILDDYETWTGPLGPVKISPLRTLIREKLNKSRFIVSNEAHKLEHSIEAMIPMLQYANPDIRITPIMITVMDFETMDSLSGELAAIIADYMRQKKLQPGKDIFFLISADANHYGADFNNAIFGEDEAAHLKGTDQDREIARECLSGKIDCGKIKKLFGRLSGQKHTDNGVALWCGKYSIPMGALTIIKTLKTAGFETPLTGEILRYSDTYTEGVLPLKKPGYGVTAPFSLKHWVGFFSAGFYF